MSYICFKRFSNTGKRAHFQSYLFSIDGRIFLTHKEMEGLTRLNPKTSCKTKRRNTALPACEFCALQCLCVYKCTAIQPAPHLL